jgi:hypothetical protein
MQQSTLDAARSFMQSLLHESNITAVLLMLSAVCIPTVLSLHASGGDGHPEIQLSHRHSISSSSSSSSSSSFSSISSNGLSEDGACGGDDEQQQGLGSDCADVPRGSGKLPRQTDAVQTESMLRTAFLWAFAAGLVIGFIAWLFLGFKLDAWMNAWQDFAWGRGL